MILAYISQSIAATFPTRATEWGKAVMLFLWGVVLAFNTDLLATTPSLTPSLQLASQPAWAYACLVVGGARLVMLVINGAWRRSPHLRAVAAFISCFFWFQISVGLIEAGTYGTGLAIYPVLLALEIYNVFRAARDAGTSDRIHTGARNGSDT